jgi:uncharacterized membrane protein YraQ (UPF0718 family)
MLTLIASVITAVIWPGEFFETLEFVLVGMLQVSPLVIPGIVISAWVNASGAGGRIREAFNGNQVRAILVASMIGAITPVCGVTVLPLMAGLLASGVPLAPIMAFWLSSPVTDPAMFSLTAATLGFHFAIAKTIAAFMLGIFGGIICVFISSRQWVESPLRETGLAATLGRQTACTSSGVEYAFWRNASKRQQFNREWWAMTKLIVICLGFAFAAEYQMQAHLDPEALANYVGKQSQWAIPLAVLVGSPAYLDGYAALPLTRGLIDHGMSPGAAMAFLVSGSVVSIWGAIAIFPVLRIKPFLLYLALAAVGSLAVGWIYDAVV